MLIIEKKINLYEILKYEAKCVKFSVSAGLMSDLHETIVEYFFKLIIIIFVFLSLWNLCAYEWRKT